MDDFTKEEFKILDQALNVAVNEGSQFYADDRINLRLKIQSMIDNYCDHDYRSMGHHNWLHCIKCRQNFNFTETQI